MRRKHPIAEFMAREHVNQPEAARRLGITQQEVSRYINWKHVPRQKKLARLAQRLGVTREALLPDMPAQGRRGAAA